MSTETSFRESINRFMTRVCMPTVLAVPDPTMRQIIFNRNKATLPLAVSMFPFYCFLMLVNPALLTPFHVINCLFFGFNGVLWILCCRNWIRFFNWYYFVTLTLYFPWIVTTYAQNLVFFAYVGSFVIPVFLTHLTSDGTISVLSFFSQLILLNTVYNSQIEAALVDCGLAAREIIVAGNFGAVVNIIFTFASYQALREAHIKISHAKEAKFEQQKAFIYSISHELRNPLNSLLGNIHLALFEPSITEVKRLVGSANICGQVLLHLVNNILDSGKLEVSSLEVNPAPNNTKEVIEDIWSVCSDLIKKKRLNGILKVSKNMPKILNIDAFRLMQIMLNLVGNAVKFTDAGSISIEFQWMDLAMKKRTKITDPLPFDDDGVFEKEEKVALISRINNETDSFYLLNFSKTMFDSKVNERLDPSPHNGVMKISVLDTGCGISPKAISKLFKMFGQVHEDPSKRKIGTGLGLFITKELCKKMDGDIQVYSKPSKGSAFVVTLPINPNFLT